MTMNDAKKSKLTSNIQVKRRLFHPYVGVGDFVKEYQGYYGRGLVIRLNNGREWYAPINEYRSIEI